MADVELWSITESPEESARFHLAVSRLVVARGHAVPAALLADLMHCDADLIVTRWFSDQVWVPAVLANTGRTVLAAGSLTYWRTPLGHATWASVQPGVEVEVASDLAEDGAARALAEVIGGSFAGYRNHYSVNPLIKPSDALDGYVEWALSCLGRNDRLVVLMTVEGEPAGAATCSLSDGAAEILLAGVLPAFQRRGLYASLLAGVAREVAARGATSLSISTQVHNVPVQRAWERFGFEPVDAVEIAHLVRPELLSAPG